ncbi:MAG: DUF1801 domain-containing protein [Flavobacteriaceae bacterium]|nr:DUF1801 domain-containing protein [Flavobacteriaceae bacterium]
MKEYTNVDAYIQDQPSEKQYLLKEIRKHLLKVVPDATEAIKYGMPTLVLHGNLVHYAAQKNHIGYYPAPSGITAFKNELQPYHTSKGAIQFPIDQPIPYDLIAKIAIFRKEENLNKMASKN